MDGMKFSSSVSLALFVVFLFSAPCESTPSSLDLHHACLLACPPQPPATHAVFFSSPQIRWMLFVVCCSSCRGDFLCILPIDSFGLKIRRSFNVWRKRTWDLGGDWKEREAKENAWIGRVGDRASDQVLLQSKNIVPHFLNHLILVFLFFWGGGAVKLGF